MSHLGTDLPKSKSEEQSLSGRAVPIGLAVWGLAISLGLAGLCIHEATPSAAGSSVAHWPRGGELTLAPHRPTLVMAAHPRCPCTRASVSELVHVLSRCKSSLEVYVLIFTPDTLDPMWGPGDDLKRLGTIPGVHLIDDMGGALAERFGAATSGQVALYAPAGRLLFRGGITGARGHEGDNRGRQAILGLIGGSSASCPSQTPVFGCPIFAASRPPAGRTTPWIN